MLKKENRLSIESFNPKKTIKSNLFNVKIGKTQGTKFGFIVSKKVDKKATVRNRIKRIFRASAENLINEIKKDKDFLFIIKKSALGKTQKEVETEMKRYLDK